ncbi:hypothetical protein SAMN04515671_1093 [Nakamurella panacisegetis]|uniref:Uncharacterized protein n=1 Tax=Nakamurella panacisegetis TaxID=1090615 RepID=A0A1H0JYN9_9ACTN|nr:hypothetical protein [Nakamurella panacisegetis]SDO48639.1 hypothetical protein SAMN04515671_1093 [Nakamurella panacisegetis]
MAFEVFDKRLTPLAKAPIITIQMRGIFSMNRAAYALMDSPSHVELLYDKDDQVIGIRGVDDDVPHGYEVRAQTRDKVSGPVIIAGTAFTQYYKIDTSVSRRWTPTVENGILRIDLKEPGVAIKGNRTAQASSGDEQES